MKKILPFIVILLLCSFLMGFCACGPKEEKEETYYATFLIPGRYASSSNTYYEYDRQLYIKSQEDIVLPRSPQERKPVGSYLPYVRSEGYTFVGWSLDGETIYDPEVKFEVKDNVRFYALYTLNEYALEYELDGGTNDERNPSSYTVEDYEIALYPATKTGYMFDGWHNYTNGQDSFYDPTYENLEAKTCSDLILRAYWTPIEYDIQYYVNTPAFTMPEGDVIIKYTIEDETPLLPLAREGYTFLGWYDNKELTGNPVEKIPVGSYGLKTFYAKWEIAQ